MSKKTNVIVKMNEVFGYKGTYIDTVFAILKSGDLHYAGKLMEHDSEIHWYFGNPETEDSKQRDDNDDFIPILSHANMQVVEDSMMVHTSNSICGFKYGKEIGYAEP